MDYLFIVCKAKIKGTNDDSIVGTYEKYKQVQK